MTRVDFKLPPGFGAVQKVCLRIGEVLSLFEELHPEWGGNTCAHSHTHTHTHTLSHGDVVPARLPKEPGVLRVEAGNGCDWLVSKFRLDQVLRRPTERGGTHRGANTYR